VSSGGQRRIVTDMTAKAAAVAEPSALATTTLFYLLVPVLILYFVYWKLQRRRFVELADKIPGPTGYPVIGHGTLLLGSPLGKFHSGGFRENAEMKSWCF
jgi:hypothetical protein